MYGAEVSARAYRLRLSSLAHAWPVLLRVSSVLARLADDCLLLIRTRRLAEWVGEGRPVTPKGVLRPADVPAAAAVLEVVVPARIRTAADVEVIHRPWVAAEAPGLIREGAGRAAAEPAMRSTDDTPEQWWTAVAAVLRTESHDDHHRGAAVLCRMLLTLLATEPPLAAADLDGAVNELFHYAGHGEVGAVYEAFRRSVMPVDAGGGLVPRLRPRADTLRPGRDQPPTRRAS